MKTWNAVAFTGGVLAMAVTTATLVVTRPDDGPRSVQTLVESSMAAPKPVSRAEATGLFVGVRIFPYDETLNVPFAADDAVDLAYQFALEQRSRLVSPRRVVLALSGAPQKEESQRRLRELKAAGARVEEATSDDILALLKKQVELAGDNGLFVLSIATHGFIGEGGDGYILGSKSSIGDPESSLRTTTLFDIAGHARQSLIFVDACRNREGQASRGAAAGPPTVAPSLKNIHVPGQAILYAAAPGGYAVDDNASRNGVFTRAVLDGLSCDASAPNGDVIVETLHKYVEREVQRWFRRNRNQTVNPATQISMEGETRRMQLARCWEREIVGEIRVETDGAKITTYDTATNPVWSRTFDQPVVHAEAVDLDLDAFQEVIVGTRDRIAVLDREGNELWRTDSGGALTTFTTGDLFRTHRRQIVSLAFDEQSSKSRLRVLDRLGKEVATHESADRLQHVAVERETNRHGRRIIVASAGSVFVFDPKKLEKPAWKQSLVSSAERIRQFRITGDDRHRIEVSTPRGTTVFAFDGAIVKQGSEWKDAGKRKRRK